MLQRLELVGFKSFADRTRFDFAPGITAVVGPNGSGKSNVVDAVRWILGEQSAKSLRGGEMADVIFNGSSSRKSLGMAEVTVAFDNTRRLLATEADEVQITRRVYRDGTGEYLVNGQMARLKDVKDVFLGSGAAGGYTIIAQGRVDELLQASTKDRRDIFDEAAGISRFKAKKLEALRKLVAVEQNLTRSKDRLDALDGQLRALRLQAAKAQRNKEYADRLRELRVGLGAKEFRELTAALEVERTALAGLRSDVTGATARTDALEKSARELDWEVGQAEDALRHREGKLAAARQQIAGFDATVRHERTAAAGHEAELLRLGRVRAEVGYRVKALEGEVATASLAAASADDRLRDEQERAAAAAAALTEAAARVSKLDRQHKADRDRQFELVRSSTAARSLATSSLAQVERLQKEYTRKRGEIEQHSARRAALEIALDGLSRADADLRSRLGSARARLTDLTSTRDGIRDAQGRLRRTLEDLRVRQGAMRGRVEVLEGLEQSFEGIGAGVREVLARLPARDGPLVDVVGLVADLLTVPRDAAAVVELALGDAAQRFVVRGSPAVDAVAAAVGDVAGRVGFFPVEEPNSPAPFLKWEGGERRALAESVRCDRPDLADLPAQLLGNVYLADTLAAARAFAAAHPGARVVTPAGELLEPDGTLTVGPLKAAAGIVSRKSELRDLREQSRALAAEVAAAGAELAGLQHQADQVGGTIEAVEAEVGLLSSRAGDLQQKIVLQRQQQAQLDENIELLQAENRVQDEEVRRGEAQWLAAKLEAEEGERAADELTGRLADLQAAIQAAGQDRDRRQAAHTDGQVALSRAAADRDRTRDRHAQLDADLCKRKIEGMDHAASFHTARGRLAAGVLAMLRATAGAAEAYHEKEARERQVAELSAKAAVGRAARETVRAELDSLRAGWREAQAAAHARELAAHDLQARRAAVAARIADDYALDLETAPEPPDLDLGAAPQEIEELKRKLARLGAVNMEALDELARVEGEHAGLKGQHDDLAAARASLQAVIDAINADSRTLFTDTLTAVRGYFQELFRKLFGGGQADIVLDDGVDVLESGIEITARPPGKELRALSLLSGGEKTLTAIALLLAIFRNKPSPFCLLDEVDAALDEANTQRLAGVLREFLDRSQFIVVTHKKRTMAAADRLWGVTMQESGVSRLLPMRFEDWPDETDGAQAA